MKLKKKIQKNLKKLKKMKKFNRKNQKSKKNNNKKTKDNIFYLRYEENFEVEYTEKIVNLSFLKIYFFFKFFT